MVPPLQVQPNVQPGFGGRLRDGELLQLRRRLTKVVQGDL